MLRPAITALVLGLLAVAGTIYGSVFFYGSTATVAIAAPAPTVSRTANASGGAQALSVCKSDQTPLRLAVGNICPSR